MKLFFLLLLLLPLCSGQKKTIKCYGEDFLMVRDMVLTCTSQIQQACYTKANGEKGCVRTEMCSKPGWTCCHTDLCN